MLILSAWKQIEASLPLSSTLSPVLRLVTTCCSRWVYKYDACKLVCKPMIATNTRPAVYYCSYFCEVDKTWSQTQILSPRTPMARSFLRFVCMSKASCFCKPVWDPVTPEAQPRHWGKYWYVVLESSSFATYLPMYSFQSRRSGPVWDTESRQRRTVIPSSMSPW